MDFSTYKLLAYGGLVVFPFFTFAIIYGASGSVALALGIAVIFTAVVAPMQFWQLDRLQSRLDDHDGSIPMGWATDWDLNDDQLSDDPTSEALAGERSPEGRQCTHCWAYTFDPRARFCARCGASLEAEAVPGPVPGDAAPPTLNM